MHTDREHSLLAKEAADWLEALKTASPAERRRFVRWLKKSPQHAWEILLASSSEIILKHLLAKAGIGVSELQFGENVHPIVRNPRLRAGRISGLPARNEVIHSSRWRIGVLLVCVGIVWLLGRAAEPPNGQQVSTAAGEWRDMQLADGTLVRAGPRTTLLITISKHQRLLRLIGGEVMVHVTRDRTRPFIVECDFVTARALGTSFAVRQVERSSASVIVEKGRVTVAPGPVLLTRASAPSSAVLVQSGQAVRVAAESRMIVPEPVDLEKELAWVQGKLLLDVGSTVAGAIDELNARNRMQIRLLDPRQGKCPLRGSFRIADPLSFIKIVEKQLPIAVLESDGTFILAPLRTRGDSTGHVGDRTAALCRREP